MNGRAFMMKPLATDISVTYRPRARMGVLSTGAGVAYMKGCITTCWGELVVTTVLDAARFRSSSRREDCCELITRGLFGSKVMVMTEAVITVPAGSTGASSTGAPFSSTQ